MKRLRRFLALLKKEFIQLLKDPKTRVTIFVPPVLQLFLLGYAATMDLREVPFAVLDHARTAESRALAAKFAGSSVFQMRPPLSSENEMASRIASQNIKLAVVIPEDFTRELSRRRPAPVQVILDGRNSFSAGIAAGYAGDAVALFNRQYAPAAASHVRICVRGWYNPNYNARYFMIPSLLAILILLALTLLVALSFAKEREGGTMDQLLLTPFSPVELLAAKGLASVFIGMAQLTFCMLFVRYWFQIPYQSDYWLLYLLFLTFLLAATGIGLAIAVHCTSLQQAMIWTFIFAMPLEMLSGMTTPVSSMPGPIQKVMLCNPIRWSIAALHRLFLEGATFRDILPTYLILSGIGTATFTLACVSLTWQRRH